MENKFYIYYLAGYPVSAQAGYPVSGKIIGRITGQISIRYNPRKIYTPAVVYTVVYPSPGEQWCGSGFRIRGSRSWPMKDIQNTIEWIEWDESFGEENQNFIKKNGDGEEYRRENYTPLLSTLSHCGLLLQEVPVDKGKQVLKILCGYKHTTSIFDDFIHYEKRQEEDEGRKQPPPHQVS